MKRSTPDLHDEIQIPKQKVQDSIPQKLTLEILKKLPKAELHCHLDGSIRISTIIELAKEQGVELPVYEEDKLSKIVCVDDNCESLNHYLKGFAITTSVLQKSYAVTRAVYEVCEDAVKDGVKYIEIRFAPLLHTLGGMSAVKVVEAACEGRAMAENNLPIIVRLIIIGMRNHSPDIIQHLAEIVWRFKHKGIVAFDLAGPEAGFSSKIHKEAFNLIRRKGLNCTIHSGEDANWESVEDSIRFCGAQRLGHGCQLIENPLLLSAVIDRGISIETCITSNIQTKAVKSFEAHPIRTFFDAGAIVVPCSDNVTVSSTYLSKEYLIYHKLFNFTVSEMIRIIDYGFRSAFLPSTEKARLRADVLHTCCKILLENGYDISGILNEKHYYDQIGVSIESIQNIDLPYWLNWDNPPISEEIVQALPKTDLHCNLEGSISLELLWNELNLAKLNAKDIIKVDVNCIEDLKNYFKNLNSVNWIDAKRLFSSVLQTKAQIERAFEDIPEQLFL